MSDKTVVGELALDLQVDATTLTKQLTSSSMTRQISGATNKMYSNSASAFSGLGKKLGALLGVAALTSFTKSCLELGSNLTEVQNVVDTTFVTMKDSLNSWAKDAMYNFGLSETKAKNYAATLGTMSQSMGTTEKQAYEMGTTIAGLAGDVASFYDTDSDEAYTKLKGIWTGETEALKSLGVVMTQTALDQYALNNGFGKTTAKMTEQEKLLLRYQYVTNALSKSSGDFIKTQDSWANQTRILQLRYESIKATLGQGLINVLTPLLKLINNLAEKVQLLAERFSSLTSSIFGNASGGSSSLDNITESANGTADSIDNITESAIKATKELAGFDKINKLGDDSSTSSSSGSSGDILGNGNSYGAQMTENLVKSIGDIDISKIVISFNEFIAKTIGNVDWEGIGESIGEFLHSIDWLGIFTSLCDVVGAALTAGFEVWIGALKEAPIETAFITLMALWKFTNVGEKVGGLLGGSIGKYAVAAIAAAIGGFSLGNALYEVFTGDDIGMSMSEQFKYLFDSMFVKKDFLRAIFGDTREVYEASRPLVNGIYDTLLEAKSLLRTDFSSIADELAQAYYDLSQKKVFTDEDIQKLSEYRTELEKYGLLAPQYVDNVTNAWKGTRDQIDKVSEKTMDLMKLQEMYNKLKQLDEDKSNAKEMIASLKDGLGDAYQYFKTLDDATLKSLYTAAAKNDWNKVRSIAGVHIGEEEIDAYKTIVELEGQIVSINKTRNNLNNEIFKTQSGVIRDEKKKLNYNLETTYALGSSLKNINIKTNYLTDKLKSGTKVNVDTGNASNKLKDLISIGKNVTKDKNFKVKFNPSSTFTSINSFITDSNKLFSHGGKKGGEVLGRKFSKAVSSTMSDATTKAGSTARDINSKLSGIKSTISLTLNTGSALKSINNFVSDARKSLKGISLGVGTSLKRINGSVTKSNDFLKISALAQGGYVKANTPQLAMIGDNRHQGEVVAPEDKLTEMALSAVQQAGSGYNKEILATLKLILQILQALDLNIVVDGKKLKDVIVAKINEQTKHTGVCEIVM